MGGCYPDAWGNMERRARPRPSCPDLDLHVGMVNGPGRGPQDVGRLLSAYKYVTASLWLGSYTRVRGMDTCLQLQRVPLYGCGVAAHGDTGAHLAPFFTFLVSEAPLDSSALFLLKEIRTYQRGP